MFRLFPQERQRASIERSQYFLVLNYCVLWLKHFYWRITHWINCYGTAKHICWLCFVSWTAMGGKLYNFVGELGAGRCTFLFYLMMILMLSEQVILLFTFSNVIHSFVISFAVKPKWWLSFWRGFILLHQLRPFLLVLKLEFIRGYFMISSLMQLEILGGEFIINHTCFSLFPLISLL